MEIVNVTCNNQEGSAPLWLRQWILAMALRGSLIADIEEARGWTKQKLWREDGMAVGQADSEREEDCCKIFEEFSGDENMTHPRHRTRYSSVRNPAISVETATLATVIPFSAKPGRRDPLRRHRAKAIE